MVNAHVNLDCAGIDHLKCNVMKTIAYWAARHVWKARILFASLSALNLLIAIGLGVLFFLMDIEVPVIFIWICIAAFVFALFLYPVRSGSKGKAGRFYKRKISQFVMIMSCVIITSGYIGFHLAQPEFLETNGATEFLPIVYNADTPDQVGKKFSRMQFRKLKKALKTRIRDFKQQLKSTSGKQKDGEPKKWQGVVLIVLAMLTTVLLGLIVASLSCSLFCSGSNALGYLVLFLGAFGVIFLGIIMIRAITAKYFKNQNEGEIVPQS